MAALLLLLLIEHFTSDFCLIWLYIYILSVSGKHQYVNRKKEDLKFSELYFIEYPGSAKRKLERCQFQLHHQL